MTIKELKGILEEMDETKDVFIFDFERNEEIDIESLSDNNGHLQINIMEE